MHSIKRLFDSNVVGLELPEVVVSVFHVDAFSAYLLLANHAIEVFVQIVFLALVEYLFG